MSVWAIVVAAGSGARFGGAKHLADLGGRRVIDVSIAVADSSADGVVLVVASDEVAGFDSGVEGVHVVAGGSTRSESVRSGLTAVPNDAQVIVVHDGARPLASAALFNLVVDAVRSGAEAAVPAVAVVDTIRHVDEGSVDRSKLVAVQTPQAFEAEALRAAHQAGLDATDDAGLVEANGGTVVLVEGEPMNIKITSPEDLAIARTLRGWHDKRVNK
ncbi:MAG: 2-C-methyl-D-erythritol 4-phosphate cytidylyltransferase [Acidimicrobiales bacterium]